MFVIIYANSGSLKAANYLVKQVQHAKCHVSFLRRTELGKVPEETALMKQPSTDEQRTREVVSAFMKALDKPENITEEAASDIAAVQMQVVQADYRFFARSCQIVAKGCWLC